MALITLTDAQLAYGHAPLLASAAFALESGERVGLIGRNGSGKSSLLQVLAGSQRLDDGVLALQQGLSRSYVPQEPQFDADSSAFDAVSAGLAEVKLLRARYEQHGPDDDLDALQTRIEALGGWSWEQRVDETLQRLRLRPDDRVASLSGGGRKKVALARALVARPDVLLLDEPTNHLDLDAIEWLHDLLANWRGALVVVSHDRAFIDAVATRIVELDRGILRSYPGNFAAYEATKQRELQSEALADARSDKLLAQEEAWVRKGVEARRTRSTGRVTRLQELRQQRAARRERIGQVRLELSTGQASGKLVAELTDVSLSFGQLRLIDHFSATVLRGDKIGLIGPNGCGKTTLLRLILGQLEPDAGRVRRGTNLRVAYFDQMRDQLDLDGTLADTISPGSEWIEQGGEGRRTRKHVMSYLGDFLFTPDRAGQPVRTLSGGERNRLLLARLFALPANVLVLDEPTNDLDIETLELLEQLLQDYAGTVFLVSHDRRFLDNVVLSLIAWEGDPAFGGRPGLWREYVGGIDDWKLQRARGAVSIAPSRVRERAAPATDANATPRARKLSYKEQRELEALPGLIETLEREQADIGERLASSELYTQEPERVAELQARYAQIEAELLAALERWEALDAAQTPQR